MVRHLTHTIPFLLLIVGTGFTQEIDTAGTVLGFYDFMEIVKNHHPVARQANLRPAEGEAAIQSARGAFDPMAYTGIDQKYFKDDQYYSLINAGVKVPTWFGIEVAAGFDKNRGQFLNPEATVPDVGLWYAGLSLPLGKGLFIDKRRAELEKAKLFSESTFAEQEVIMNKLLFDAGKVYWDWFNAYYVMEVFEEAFELADIRYRAVKREATLGDAAPVDTLEAGIQLQNRILSLQQSKLDFANATQVLTVHLWLDGIAPVELAPDVRPDRFDEISINRDDAYFLVEADSLVSSHPLLVQSRLKIEQLDVERRLRREFLKPDLNLKYNAISAPVNGNPFPEYTINDYTWGVEFKMPLFLRKERGDLKLAEIDIANAEFDLAAKTQNIRADIEIALNQWHTTDDQILLYTRTVQDYLQLLEAERILFNLGESSLFLVNSREVGYISARIKLVELMSKNRKAQLSVRYSLGALNRSI